jgi:hypothetical protein
MLSRRNLLPQDRLDIFIVSHLPMSLKETYDHFFAILCSTCLWIWCEQSMSDSQYRFCVVLA